MSREFLGPAQRGGKHKDPLRLLASAVRGSGLEVANAAPLAQAQQRLEEEGMAAWPGIVAALAEGRMQLAAEPPRPYRQASVAPPMRALPGGREQPATVASPAQVRPEAPTPSARAMAAAARTPPLARGTVELLSGEAFLRY
jgi:hypothetical protein